MLAKKNNFFGHNKSKSVRMKPKQNSWKKLAKDFLVDYMDSSTLHGVKYIVNPSPWTSILWICIMIASITFCAILIKVQMKKFDESILTTTIASTAHPVWSIAFPAVTVCNNIVVTKTGASKIVAMLEKQGIEARQAERYLRAFNHFITRQWQLKYDKNIFPNISSTLRKLGYNSDRIMYEVALPCEKQFTYCQWKMMAENCSNLFYMIKTSRGYCCSFNAYGATTYHQKYEGNTSQVVHFTGSAGQNSGLLVRMDILSAENFSSVSGDFGFDVYVHDGQDYPDFSLFAKTVPPSTSQTISLTPSLIDSKPTVRDIPPYSRGCRFEDEYKLTWSSSYNFQTCLHECKAKIIYSICQCIPFYYPNTDNVKSCDLEDIQCLQKNKKAFTNLVMSTETDYTSEVLIHKHLGEVRRCDCLPDCNDVTYAMSLNTVTSPMLYGPNISKIQVHYSTISCIRYLKDVYFTWDMFLAAVGGIFGLCLGGSIISAIELIYYILTYSCTKHQIQPKKVDNKEHKVVRNDPPGIKIIYPVFEYTP